MNNLDKQYIDLLKDIVENGTKKMDRTGTGTISVFGRTIRHKMSEGFPLLTSKKMYAKGIITELLWFLRGETNIRPLVLADCHIWNGDAYKRYYNKECLPPHDHTLDKEQFVENIKNDPEFAEKWGELGPIYGKQWRHWRAIDDSEMKIHTYEIDQIKNLINDLKNNPDSRRLMVNAWNVAEIGDMTLPPCHYGFQCYTRELTFEERWELSIKYGYTKESTEMPSPDATYLGLNERSELEYMWNDPVIKTDLPKRAISLIWTQRSVDTPLGLPFNIASYGLLLSLLGHICNMVPDELIGNLGDTHIYLNQLDGVNEQINRVSHDLPTLYINGEFWLPNWDDPRVQEDGCSNRPGSFSNDFDALIKGIEVNDFIIDNYVSEPTIKFPLSN
jgi:thymidylate synthase